MQTLQIKNFKGINLEEGLWNQGFARYAAGVDIFGLQDNVQKQSIPGVIQGARTMISGTQAAPTNNIADLIRSFTAYPLNGSSGGALEVWGLSDSTRLYKRVASNSTWTLQRSTAGGDLSNTGGGGGLASFGGSLWVSENGRVDRWNGATSTWTANFGAFSTAGTTPRPMRTMAGNLFIGNDRYVSQIDSSFTFTATKLTLPSDFIVKSMEIFGDRLYIFADNGEFSRLFIWDGISTTFGSYFDLRQESTAPHMVFNDGVLWCVANRGIAVGTPIYTFNGYTFTKQMILPIGIFNAMDNILTTYNGGIIIGSTNTGSSIFEDGVAGIWTINRYDANHPYQAALLCNPSAGVLGTQIGAVYSNQNILYVSTKNTTGPVYEVWEVSNDTNSVGIWQSLPIDAGDASRTKVWHGIQVDSELPMDTANAGRTITVKYRTDYNAAFTSLKTITSGTGDSNLYIPIGRTGKVIEIRFELNSNTNVLGTRLHGFSLSYSPTGQ